MDTPRPHARQYGSPNDVPARPCIDDLPPGLERLLAFAVVARDVGGAHRPQDRRSRAAAGRGGAGPSAAARAARLGRRFRRRLRGAPARPRPEREADGRHPRRGGRHPRLHQDRCRRPHVLRRSRPPSARAAQRRTRPHVVAPRRTLLSVIAFTVLEAGSLPSTSSSTRSNSRRSNCPPLPEPVSSGPIPHRCRPWQTGTGCDKVEDASWSAPYTRGRRLSIPAAASRTPPPLRQTART
jgi:hypothetical protein